MRQRRYYCGLIVACAGVSSRYVFVLLLYFAKRLVLPYPEVTLPRASWQPRQQPKKIFLTSTCNLAGYGGNAQKINTALGKLRKSRLTWDNNNRLRQIQRKQGNQLVRVRYLYDVSGRRIAKHADVAADGQFREKKYGLTLFGWDGDTLAFEYNEQSRETTHYFYEPGSFIPMLQTRSTQWGKATDQKPGFDQTAWYHCDHLGTPLEMTDEQGKIVWSARYEAFGKASVSTKEKYRNPIRFQGQYEDEETGLHYNYHRYYDPRLGMYLSKDPIGLAGGVNLKGYVKGSPDMIFDPKGLTDKDTFVTAAKKIWKIFSLFNTDETASEQTCKFNEMIKRKDEYERLMEKLSKSSIGGPPLTQSEVFALEYLNVQYPIDIHNAGLLGVDLAKGVLTRSVTGVLDPKGFARKQGVDLLSRSATTSNGGWHIAMPKECEK